MGRFIFDDDYHPELLSIALKEEWLREFVRLATDTFSAMEITARGLVGPDAAVAAGDLKKEVLGQLTGRLSQPVAEKFGVDGRDLLFLLRQRPNGDGAAREDKLRAYLRDVCERSLVNYFCACVARQEGAGQAYDARVEQATQSGCKEELARLRLQKVACPEQFSGRQRRMERAMEESVVVGTFAVELKLLEDRHSPLAEEQRELFCGNRYGGSIRQNFREKLAVIFELAPDQRADRVALGRIERDCLKVMYQALGVATSPSFAL